MTEKRLGQVIQEVTAEIRTWPAWAQPYRPSKRTEGSSQRSSERRSSHPAAVTHKQHR